jgi:hypothetical protein
MTQKDTMQGWKQARYMQIKKLNKQGVKRLELEKRFGAQNVSDALDKTQTYC